MGSASVPFVVGGFGIVTVRALLLKLVSAPFPSLTFLFLPELAHALCSGRFGVALSGGFVKGTFAPAVLSTVVFVLVHPEKGDDLSRFPEI